MKHLFQKWAKLLRYYHLLSVTDLTFTRQLWLFPVRHELCALCFWICVKNKLLICKILSNFICQGETDNQPHIYSIWESHNTDSASESGMRLLQSFFLFFFFNHQCFISRSHNVGCNWSYFIPSVASSLMALLWEWLLQL